MRYAPTKVYFLVIHKGAAKGLGYGRRGGGLFTRRDAAFERGEWLVRSGKIESFVVGEADCEWHEVSK